MIRFSFPNLNNNNNVPTEIPQVEHGKGKYTHTLPSSEKYHSQGRKY